MMVSCLLMYLKVKGCRTAQQALDYYAKHRTKSVFFDQSPANVLVPSDRSFIASDFSLIDGCMRSYTET